MNGSPNSVLKTRPSFNSQVESMKYKTEVILHCNKRLIGYNFENFNVLCNLLKSVKFLKFLRLYILFIYYAVIKSVIETYLNVC